MVSGRCGRRAALARLVVLAAVIVAVAGCTGSSARSSPTAAPAAGGGVAPGAPAAGPCGPREVRAAIADFFVAWNRRDAPALGRLFAASGEFDLTTKGEHAVDGRDSWYSAGGGAGSRGQIAAFAQRQWRLGEKLSYRGIQTVLNGGTSGDGGYVGRVVARFGDGTVQPMGYAKFIYGCTSRAFLHVVIVSAKAASPT